MSRHSLAHIGHSLRTKFLLPLVAIAAYGTFDAQQVQAADPIPINKWGEIRQGGAAFDQPDRTIDMIDVTTGQTLASFRSGRNSDGSVIDPGWYSTNIDGGLEGRIVSYRIDTTSGMYHMLVQKGAAIADRDTLDVEYFDATNLLIDTPVSVVPDLESQLDMSVFPNPSNPQSTIRFSTDYQSPVSLRIYDLKGREVRTLLDDNLPSGPHSIPWDGKNNQGETVASGVYQALLITPEEHSYEKIVVVK